MLYVSLIELSIIKRLIIGFKSKYGRGYPYGKLTINCNNLKIGCNDQK